MKSSKSAKTVLGGAIFGLFISIASVASAQVIYGGGYGSYQQVYSYPQNYGYNYGNSCPQFGTFYIGMRGYQVTQLQSYLASRGYAQPITGYYGPVTHVNWTSACGSSYNPYQPYPTNTYNYTTFRLDRSFTLYEGRTGRLSNGELEVTLNDVDSRDDEARITVGMPCRQGTYCFYYPSRSYTLEEGDDVRFEDYTIKLNSVSSNRASFRVDDRDNDDDDDARIEITEPMSGEDFEQGDEMLIEWDVQDEPSDAEVVLELFDEDDDRVGTIAIEDADEGEFEWDIPEAGDFCTQQFPNGLCGYDLDGDYYIRATLKDGSTSLDSDKSGVFNIED